MITNWRNKKIRKPFLNPPECGAKVIHSVFGEGTVTTLEGPSTFGPIIGIQFDAHGLKKLQWCFAKGKLGALATEVEKPTNG